MKYKLEIESDKKLDSCLFEVYLDIKKKLYIKKQELPKTLTKVDCECVTTTKYCVK